MALPSPQVAAAAWQRGMANATEKMKAGVQAVTESPTAKAARRADAYIAGVQRAVSNNKWQSALNAVSTDDWRNAYLQKGIPRVASGAAQAQPKMADFMAQFFPHLQAGLAKLATMPRGDIEQNIARAAELMRHNAQFRRNR